MHYYQKKSRFRLLRGQLVREVYAVYGSALPFAVFREWEDGRRASRNIEHHFVAGWLYSTPEEIGREEWNFDYAPRSGFGGDDYLSPEDVELIAQARPAFRWCLRKADERGYTSAQVFELLRAFEADPRVELLVEAGLKHLALSSGFRRLSKRLQQDVSRWAIQNGDYGLRAAIDCLRERISIGDWARWRGSAGKTFAYKVWKHLDAHGIYPWEYREYLDTLRQAGKDVNDPYWGLPTDFARRRRQAERIVANLRKAKTRKEREERRAALEAVAAKFAGGVFGSCRVWVPCSIEEVEKQADALDQCLLSMDYAGKVKDGDCVLVFVADDAGKPLATAELLPSGNGYKVGQFYGDERKSDYLAGEEERAALRAWAKRNKLRLRAA